MHDHQIRLSNKDVLVNNQTDAETQALESIADKYQIVEVEDRD